MNQSDLQAAWAEFDETLSDEDRDYFESTAHPARSPREVLWSDMDRASIEMDPDVARRTPRRPTSDEAFGPETRDGISSVWEESDTPLPVREVRMEFFDHYTAQLPLEQQELILEHVGSRESFADIAKALGRSRSAAFERYQTAVRALVRAIALDDPDFVEEDALRNGPNPKRDYDEELRAAGRVCLKAGLLHEEQP